MVVLLSLKHLIMVIICAVQVVSGGTIVCLRSGNEQCIQGVDKVTSFSTNYEVFLGIPFAKPPVGQLRFANPVPNDPWPGIYDASQLKPDCIQRNEVFPLPDILGSEDCLYLNVYRPKNVSNNLPVLVYIHGGGFQVGSASPTLSGPDRFMNSGDAILVTVSYRLGALGFLSTGDSEAPGNFGLKDQSMAIRWVKKYISTFGGDSQLITVFGEDAGGAATQLHMMSPLSRGNFSRAILISGSAFAGYARPRTDAPLIAKLQAKVLGLTAYDALTSAEVITFLRSIPAEQLVGSYDEVLQMLPVSNIVTIYRPVVEQYVKGQSFLHESPLALWAAGNYEQIPWLVGHVPNAGIIISRLLLRYGSDPTQWLAIITHPPNVDKELLGVPFSLLFRGLGNLDLTSLSPVAALEQTNKPLSEAHFEYPLLKSVTQHLQHANPLEAPVSVYFMNFIGPYTLAPRIMPNSTLPIGFRDDLQYVFHESILFPAFPLGAAGRLMAIKMLKMFVEFTRTGHPLPSYLGTCSSLTHCRQIVFSNGVAGSDPVQVELTDAIDFEVLNFWDAVLGNGFQAKSSKLKNKKFNLYLVVLFFIYIPRELIPGNTKRRF